MHISLGQRPTMFRVATVAAIALCTVSPRFSTAQQFVNETNARLPAASPLEYSEQVDLADIDGDGDLDILFANGRGFGSPSLQETNRLYLNDGNGVFTDVTDARMAGITGFTRDVEFADIDADGDLDLLIVNAFNNQPRMLINDGNGFFADETGSRLPAAVIGGSDADFGDVDDDGDLDIIFTNSGSSPFGAGVDRLYINDGTGVFTDETAARLPGSAVSQSIDCDFFDMDGDLDLDLVMVHRDPASQLWENDGSGNYTNVTAGRLPSDGSGTYSIDPGDIDGDGDLDLLVVRGSNDRIFRNNGGGVFTDITATAIPVNPFQDDNDGDFFDYDADGDLDFAIARLGSGGERIYQNNGSGVFTLQSGIITVISDSSLDIEFGDVNGDGRVDIVTAQGESGSFRNRIYINQTGAVDTTPPTFPNMTALSPTNNTAGPYVVKASIRDNITSDNNFFDRGVYLHYTVGAGQPNTLPMTWVGGDLYRGEIPGLAAGSSVSYWVTATDFAGNTGTSPTAAFPVFGGLLGDGDGDNDLDLEDVGGFFDCVTGPIGQVTPACRTYDFDGDQNVSFDDFAWFQLAYGS